MYISNREVLWDLLVFNSIVIVSYSFLSYTVTLHKLLAILALTLLYSENQHYSHMLPRVVRDRNIKINLNSVAVVKLQLLLFRIMAMWKAS